MAELWYPELLTDINSFPAHMLFTFFERDSTVNSSIQDQIHLYMPEQMSQPNTISWDSTFKGAQAVLGGVGDVLGMGGMRNAGAVLRGLGTAFGGVDSGSDAARSFSQVSGMMLNPYLAQLFRGVDFRNFQFMFRFVPFTEKDCDTILNIINTFRKWSLPEGPDKGAGSAYLTYPGEVEIEYIWSGGTNKYLHKFKRSVISSLDVNYTGAGQWTMMRNGFPTETVLTISFSEIQIIVRNDVADPSLGY